MTASTLAVAGLIAPAYCESRPELVQAHTTAGVEAHRPDQPDLFLTLNGVPNPRLPPHYVDHADWPDLLSEARHFAASKPPAAEAAEEKDSKSQQRTKRKAVLTHAIVDVRCVLAVAILSHPLCRRC